MELTRIIHPVGQGGFYSETLRCDENEINVIYDCGGNSIITMEKYLDNYFPNRLNKKIDAVFISHLHDDHINGLKYLLDNYNVKFLFLPQLTRDEQLELLLYLILKNRGGFPDNYGMLIWILTENQYNETQVIRISHSNGDDYIRTEINGNDVNIEWESLEKNTINTGTKIYFEPNWLFIPYNPPVKTNNGKSFYDKFKEVLRISDFSFDELPSIVRNNGLEKCKGIYRDFFRNNHNAYSMTLFSGVAEPDYRFIHYCDYCEDICSRLPHRRNKKSWSSPNCLYTGDFDTQNQFDNMKSFYGPLWETIGSIQVPHHGSRNNFCPQMYEYAHHVFISVGERNRYHHPSVNTLIGIKQMHCNLEIITESLSSMKMFHYKI